MLDAPRAEALDWLAANRPLYLPHTSETVCSLRDVRFSYGDRVVLDGVSLEVRRGEIVALTGPNGVGKTTLGADRRRARRARRRVRCSTRGRLPDAGSRPAHGARAGARRGRARRGRDACPRALADVGLAGFEERHPRDLSAGERERLALAAVLATEPDLLVLDEPTRGVDPERKAELARLLRAQAPGARDARHHARPGVGGRGRRPRRHPRAGAGGRCVRNGGAAPARSRGCCSSRRSP